MLVKRSFTLSGHRTSIALEPEFWVALEAKAHREQQPVGALIAEIDRKRNPTDPLTSRLRVLVLVDALTSRKGEPGIIRDG